MIEWSRPDLPLDRLLTLSLGLRYEYHQPFLDKNGREYSFNPDTQQLIVPSPKSLKLVSPLLSPVFKIVTADEAGYPDRLLSFGRGNLVPRFGFAYRLTPQTVVRGGYGIYYDFNPPYQANLGPYQPSESFPNNVITGRSARVPVSEPVPRHADQRRRRGLARGHGEHEEHDRAFHPAVEFHFLRGAELRYI